MEEVREILVATVAWIMLLATTPLLGAVLGRYLGIALVKGGNVSYKGALGALSGYLIGVAIAIFAIFQVIDHAMEALGVLFPHIR